MKNKRILELVNQYNSLTDLGKAFEGMRVLNTIENLLTPADDVIREGNCQSFRAIISNLLF